MKKKIVFIAPQLYPDYIGGMEIFNYYLIQKLSEVYDVGYISKVALNIEPLRHYRLSRINALITYLHLQILVIKCALNKNILILSFARSQSAVWLIYPLLNIILKTKYIIVIHGGGMAQWKCKLIYRLLFKNASKIFGVSDVICNEYERRSGMPITLLPPLIPFERSTEDINELRKKNDVSPDANVFIYVGSLKPLKNPGFIIDALLLLGKKYLEERKIIVLFIGAGILQKDLKNKVLQANLQNHVRLLGIIKREKIKHYYKICNAYIISSDFEGTPLAMAEAMFNKVPILAANVRGINSLIQNNYNGLLFDNKNPADLSDKIKLLLSGKVNTKIISQNAFEYFTANYSYATMLNKINGTIQNIQI